MKLKLFLLLAIISFSCQLGYTQAWSGILDPSRAIDWSGAGIPGGIPNRTAVCQTVPPSGDTTGNSDSTNIDNTITACSGKSQVVLLQTGTYYVAGVTFGTANNVTLRGAGPDKTKLVFTGVISCGLHADICMEGSSGWPGNYPGSTAWTAGYTKGSNQITVASTTGLSTGQTIILDQRDDAIGIVASPNGATESGNTVTITTSLPHGYSTGQTVGVGCVGSPANSCSNTTSGYDGVYTITAVPTSTTFQYTDSNTGLAASGSGQATVDTGGVYASCVGGPTCSDESGSGTPDIGRACPDTTFGSGSRNGVNQCQAGEISYRDQMELKSITAINGDQITINPPLEMPNWRSAQSPGVWWTGNYITGDGVESMTLDYTNDGGLTYRTGGVVFYNAYECWTKNIRSVEGNRNHVWIQQSARIDVEDNYFWGTKGGHSQSYGVEVYNGDSDNLIQNNICQHVVDCVMVAGDWGSVYAYNYAIDSGYNTTDWLAGMANENHDFAGYDLFEGNDVDAEANDDIHGSSTAATDFRNRLRGQDTPAKSNDLSAAQDNSFNRFVNFVGNVIGTAGVETTYQVATPGYKGQTSVYDMGTESDNGGTPNDPLTTSTALRWGNYDTATGAVRWCGNSLDPGWSSTCASTSEIPALSLAYINGNAVPTSTTLPKSFYLSSQPSFWQTTWGTPPWPAIGPDVTGGNAPDGAGGKAYAIPAQICYENTSVDPAYQQTFKVTGASWSSGTATLTIASNTLVADDTVTVSGVSPSGYNGTFAVTAETSTSISYALPSNPGSYGAGGSVAYPNILLFNAANCYPGAYASVQSPTNLTATPH